MRYLWIQRNGNGQENRRKERKKHFVEMIEEDVKVAICITVGTELGWWPRKQVNEREDKWKSENNMWNRTQLFINNLTSRAVSRFVIAIIKMTWINQEKWITMSCRHSLCVMCTAHSFNVHRYTNYYAFFLQQMTEKVLAN